MGKEGKADILSVLIASIVIFVVYAVLVFGQAVVSHFPENSTNASATTGIAAVSLAPMGAFNGTNGLFSCNITLRNVLEYNVSNISLFLSTSPITDVDADSTPNITHFTGLNESGALNQTINFSVGSINEGTYHWACAVATNNRTVSALVINSTTNKSFIIDKTQPGVANLIINTSKSSVNTSDTISVAVNFTDQLTTIHTIRLFVNSTGTSNNEVNITESTNGVGAKNGTFTNLSFTLSGNLINAVLNFTFQANDSVNNVNNSRSMMFVVTADGTPPGINLSYPATNFNTSSTGALAFNFSAEDNNASDTSFTCALNISLGGIQFESISPITVTNGVLQSNSSTTAFTNGTYSWSVNCTDGAGNVNSSLTRTFTVDTIPPKFDYYNFTDTSLNITVDSNRNASNGTQLGLGNRASTAQGRTIYAISNWTDNLTQPLQARLQFYNGSWVTLSNTGANNVLYNQTNWANFSYTIATGHNEFEGRNISFRVIANDTVGNINDSSSVKNFTIQINDTTNPTLTVTLDLGANQNGERALNGTNTSDTTPTVVWNLTDGSSLRYVAIQIDGSTSQLCNKFVNYTVGDGLVEAQRNGSITVSSDGACPLAAGTRVVRFTAEDQWGNTELYIHSFSVETGTPTITLSNLTNGLQAVNKSNTTSNTGMTITAAATGGTARMKNLSWSSSCNSATVVTSTSIAAFTAANNSPIYPFNLTRCPAIAGTTANRTVTVSVADDFGNSNTNTFTFLVDNTAPSLGVNVTNKQRENRNFSYVISALDDSQAISSVGYYLDGNVFRDSLNTSGALGRPATNYTTTVTVNNSHNFTAGTHTIKFSANDSLGNQFNTSEFTITIVAPLKPVDINASLTAYLETLLTVPTNVTIRKQGSGGDYQSIGTANQTTSDATFEIRLDLNSSSSTRFINVTITEINGSGANWDKINFSIQINHSLTRAQLENNFSANVSYYVMFNASFEEFLPNENDYYATILLPYNTSSNLSIASQVWFFPNSSDLTQRTNVSQCTGGFTKETTVPCWNYTYGGRTLLQVPHLSGGGIGSDERPPTVTVNKPAGTQTESTFLVNITVSNDATLCNMTYVGESSSLSSNITMEGPSTLGTDKQCYFNLNVTNGTRLGNNMTFRVVDTSGNINTTTISFNISDTTVHNLTSLVISSVSETGAVVTITANESVNMSIKNSTGATALIASMYSNVTNLGTTQSITFSGLTASSTYNFTVKTCDKAQNCIVNNTLGFTTSAAAAAASSSSSSSGSSGGGGGAAAASTVSASKAQVWGSIPAGSSFSLDVDKADIAVTSVAVNDVKSELSNVELEVAALTKNPVSEEAASKVYQYLRITKKNVKDADAGSFKVAFRVTKVWLSENSLASGDVSLYRFADSKWNELTTKVSGTDSTYVTYESDTPGFSSFAIGTKTGVTVEEEAPAEEAAPAEAPEEGAPTPVEKPTPVQALGKAPVAWIIAAVVVILGIILIVMYQKKKQQG
ncbi:PGF-pre-PGF domain-containing protein [Candidatus Woesearchaeota archaeon]|nr:PGF-pre-PGF domain-containing protein [Candidatus Woesearchaeota archaeon]